jgi:hypothetical protein
MNGAITPLPQYAFMVWCSAKAQGKLYLYLFLYLNWPHCFYSNQCFSVFRLVTTPRYIHHCKRFQKWDIQCTSTLTTFNISKSVLTPTNTTTYCDNIVTGRRVKCWLPMYMQWQGMSIVENEQLLFVTFAFKPSESCNEWRKLLIERNDLVAVMFVFLKHGTKLKQPICDILRVIIS